MTGPTIQALAFVAYSCVLGPSLAVVAIGESTPIQLGLFFAGLGTAIALTWKISKWVARIENRLNRMEGKPTNHRRQRETDR